MNKACEHINEGSKYGEAYTVYIRATDDVIDICEHCYINSPVEDVEGPNGVATYSTEENLWTNDERPSNRLSETKRDKLDELYDLRGQLINIQADIDKILEDYFDIIGGMIQTPKKLNEILKGIESMDDTLWGSE